MIKRVLNQGLLCLLSAIFVLTPLEAYIQMIIIVGLFGLWFVSTLFIDSKWVKQTIPYFSFLIFVIVLDYILGSIWYDPTLQLLGVNKIPLFIWPILFLFYARHLDLMKWPLWIILGMLLCSAIYTYIGNMLFPGASRALASASDELAEARAEFKAMFIGGYDFIYAVTFMLLPLLLMARHAVVNKLMVIAYVIFMSITILTGAYFMSVLFSIVMILLSVVDVKNISRFLVSIIVVGILAYAVQDAILDWLIAFGESIDSEILSKRALLLKEGGYTYEYGEGNRFALYRNAFENYLDRPLLGALEGVDITYRRSGHSALLDYLEKYGLLSIVYVMFFRKVYKDTSSALRSVYIHTEYMMYYIAFMIFLLVNGFAGADMLAYMVFFCAPIMFLMTDRKIIK